MLKLIFDIIQSGSIILASCVAIYGINSWRRETKWKRKFELAEEVLSLFYECKENFQIIRNPAGHSLEGNTRKRGENETPAETQILDSAYVFIERYEKVKDPFVKLWPLKYRFMTIFGKESGKPFDEIRIILNTIFHAASKLGKRYWKEQGHKDFGKQEFERHLKEMEENENIVWQNISGEDSISSRIDMAVRQIEGYCESIVSKR